MSTRPVDDSWKQYEGVASTFARVSEPHYFAGPARDLVALLEVRPGERILDVGTGTGAVPRAALDALDAPGLLVGVDASVEMLRSCRSRVPEVRPVVGALPDFPCAAPQFDVVTAAFVLSHVADWRGGLRALVETLRPRGRLGSLSWISSPSETPPGEIWERVTGAAVDGASLDRAVAEALPSDERFASPPATESALRSAGLEEIRLVSRTYTIEMSTSAYVESRGISFSSRYLRSRLGTEVWRPMIAEARRQLEEVFGTRVGFELEACLAVGVAGESGRDGGSTRSRPPVRR